MGYTITSIQEAESIIRNVSLYTTIGLAVAETEGEKQFILERIALELGMSLPDLREMVKKFDMDLEPGTPMDISEYLKQWGEKEAKRRTEIYGKSE